MSSPNSDFAPDANLTFDADALSDAEQVNSAISEHSASAVSQESLQTLDSLSAASHPSVPSMSPEDQSGVRTLDSRDLDSNLSALGADAVGQTSLETPKFAESQKTGDRSIVSNLVSSASRPKPSHPAERYVLLDNFAHGGLGNLWRAEDKAIRREVAFKELLPRALKNPVHVERFVEEAQITGQLEHPGIIPIYDVGFQENGTPYYAMKLVRGGNMEVAIEAMHKLPSGSPERQLAFNRLLRQFIAVCQAVGFAHDKGVLHRDLKPLNVMLGEFGETLVLDWGLAKLVDLIGEQMISSDRSSRTTPNGEPFVDDGESEVATIMTDPSTNTGATREPDSRFPHNSPDLEATQAVTARWPAEKNPGPPKSGPRNAGNNTFNATTATATGQRRIQTGMRSAGSATIMGQVMGTPAYMSPEQALGQIDELDSRTDIYSLGGILYKLLSNQQPVGRGRVQEVLDKVILGLIPPPRTIDPTIPKPLEAICLKAMSKDKMARYPKALDVAADVEAWLADQPVSAYPDRWHTRLRRWSKRHRTLVVSSTATIVVLIGSIFFVLQAAANRLSRQRSEVRSKIADARAFQNRSDFGEAERLLNVAKGIVDSEPKLIAERDEINSQFAELSRSREAAERERVAAIRNEAEVELATVQKVIHEEQDFAQAKLSLTRIAESLKSEPTLSELEQTARTRLLAVIQFESFAKEVEQARIFGGSISGEDSLDELQESKRRAMAALKFFEVDEAQPDKADSRLSSLGEISVAKWRDRMQELLVTLAYLETRLAINGDKAELQAAAQRSLKHLLQAERLGLSSQAMWYLRVDLYSALDQQPESKKAKQVAESLQAKTRLDFYLLGELARAEGRYADAAAAYQDALRVDPEDFWSLNMLGLCNVQLQRYEAAIASYTACIAQRPRFHWPYLTRGVAFGHLKRFSAAQEDFAKALEIEGETYHVALNRGAISFLQQDYVAAQADFEKASKLKPEQAAPYINLALAHYERANQIQKTSSELNADVLAKSEYQKALVALTAATQRSSRQAGVYALRGSIQFSIGDLKSALGDFERAIQLEQSPARRAGHFKQVGLVHSRAGRLPEAVSAYDRSLADNADDPEVIRWRAEAAMLLERFDEAVQGFTSYLAKAGPVAEIYQSRATALTKLGRHNEAINDYTMFLQLSPRNAQAAQMLALRGQAYLSEANKLGKSDFEEAIRLNPLNPNHFHGLARALVLLGDHASAIAKLKECNKLDRQIIDQVGARAWPFLYNPATVYSLATGKVLLDAKVPPEEREQLAKQYTRRAVELLLEAHKLAGPQLQAKVAEYMRTDSELNPIRQTPEFLEALKSID